MARDPIGFFCFSLVVVKLGRRILLVHEKKHGQLWYFPAGRVELGETFAEAAIRETAEEAGIDIELEGVLRVEHSPGPSSGRMRVLYLARPKDDGAPKAEPDEHTLGAQFFTLEEIEALPLRGSEVLAWCRHALSGGPIYPLTVVGPEGAAP